MVKYLNIGKGGLIDLYGVKGVGEVGVETSHLQYVVYMKSGYMFEVFESDFPRIKLIEAVEALDETNPH